MSADLLRRAAALMRERAEAATPGPWLADPDTWHPHGNPLGYRRVVSGEANPISGIRTPHLHTALLTPPASPEDRQAAADAAHVASWHPAVALAVADWLDACALVVTAAPGSTKAHAERVARAYLGEAGDA